MVNGECYANELPELREEIKKKRHEKLRRSVQPIQENVPAHSIQVAEATANECGFRILLHRSCSTNVEVSFEDRYVIDAMILA